MSRYLEHVYDGGEVALVPPHDGEAGEADQEQGAGHHPLASVRSETAAVSSSDTLLTSRPTAVSDGSHFCKHTLHFALELLEQRTKLKLKLK